MQVKKKSLAGKNKGSVNSSPDAPAPGKAGLSDGVVSMRRVVAKKLAVEKLVTAKRLG